MLSVAVVEDETDLREEICEFLALSGMVARGMGSAEELDDHLLVHACDAVVLDVNLPGEDGFRIARRLGTRDGLGVVMVTSRAALEDRVHGLRTGADAYMVKPVDLQELVATVESVCRRTKRDASAAFPPPAVQGPSVEDCTGEWRLRRLGWELVGPNGQFVALTAAEHDFLGHLVAAPGLPVSRADLLGAQAPADSGDLRKLDAVVRRLRRKVEEEIGLPLPVRAVHGVGYTATELIAG